MRSIIIDDEALAREGIEKYAKQIAYLQLLGSYENALLAAEILQSGQVDLMFLDIHMPYLGGIELLKTLKNPPLVILHTAYPTYALEGYQLDVIDYLVKPVSFERFFKAVSKAHEYFALLQKNVALTADKVANYIFIKCEKRYEKVMLAEILYIEAMQNYSIVQTARQKLLTLTNLKSFEELLPAEQFARVQKSYIVSLDKVESFEGNQIKVGSKMIPLGKQQREELFNRLVSRKK